MLKTMAEKFPLVSISDYLLCYARVAQLVEHQTFNLGVAGSSPATGTIYAVIAQQVERILGLEICFIITPQGGMFSGINNQTKR